MAKVTKGLLCIAHRVMDFANMDSCESQFSNNQTSKATANFPYSSVDVSLMKPQIKSQIAHDHKKNHQAYGGARDS